MQDIKAKVKAVAAGALMVGATLAGSVMALDLGDLPRPFVEDNAWNAVAVLGTGGSSRSGLAEDLIASAQVLTTFAQSTVPIEEKSASGLTGVAKITVSGVSGKTDEVPLFNQLGRTFGTSLDDNDLPMLLDKQYSSTSSQGSTAIDVEETVQLGTTTIDQYEGNLGIEIPSSQLTYNFKFDDQIDDNGDGVLSCADWTTGNSSFTNVGTMDVEFLGYPVTIKCLTASKLEIEGGTEGVLNLGETIQYSDGDGDWGIKLMAVDDNANKAYLEVTKGSSSEKKVIDVDTQDTALGLEIKVESAFPSAGGSDAFAQIKYGTKLSDTLTAGEKWPYDKDYECAFTTNGNAFKPVFQLKYSPDTAVEDSHAIGAGETWSSFNDAFDIDNNGFYIKDTAKFTVEEKSDSVYPTMAASSTTSKDAISFAIPQDVSLYNGSSTSDKLYTKVWFVYQANGTVVMNSQNSDGTKLAVGQSDGIGYDADGAGASSALMASGSYGTTNLKVWWNNTNGKIVFDIGGDDNITINAPNDGTNFIALTGTDGNAAVNDLYYNDSLTNAISTTSHDKQLGTYDYDWWTEYGVLVEDPQTNLESGNGRVVFSVPNKQQKLVVLVGKDQPTTKELGAGESYGSCDIDEVTVSGTIREAGEVMPIAVDVAKLDTEIADSTSTNMIIFGGPSVNALAADLGYTASDFMDGSDPIGIVELVENAFGGTNSALVIAGYDAANTRMAGWVAAHYPDYDLAGKSRVVVKGTEATSLEVA